MNILMVGENSIGRTGNRVAIIMVIVSSIAFLNLTMMEGRVRTYSNSNVAAQSALQMVTMLHALHVLLGLSMVLVYFNGAAFPLLVVGTMLLTVSSKLATWQE
jgi:hypothetical protein